MQDVTKTGADFGLLEKEFNSIVKEYGPRVDKNYTSPLDKLRQLVPHPPSSIKPLSYPIDQDLILRDGHEHAFNEHTNDGIRFVKQFNKMLTEAIRLGEQIGTLDILN